MSKSLPIVGAESASSSGGAKQETGIPRRDFALLVFGWIGTLGSLAAATLAGMRGLLPNLLDEPDQRFRAGKPEDYSDGTVAFIEEIRTFLVRKDNGFRAMSGVCTHLGCTVNRDHAGYRCPCHGSVFDDDGQVLSGPAPRPLDCYGVALTRDGRLVVDRGRSVSPEQFLVLETRAQPTDSGDEGEQA